MNGHLGDLVSALADGQLGPTDTHRALGHVAACPLCAAELESARAARRRLTQACDVVPTPELTERLLALSASIPPVDRDPLRAPDRDTTWQTPEAWRTTLTGDLAGTARRRRRHRLALVGAGGAGVLGCALFVLGQAPVVSPEASRAAALSTLAGTDEVSTSVTDEIALDSEGYVAPGALPTGYQLAAVRTDGKLVEIDLTGPEGLVVVRERPGRLDDVVVSDMMLDVPGRGNVHVLTRDPWHVAWQAGDMVVEATTDAPHDVLVDVVAAFPDDDYDAGVLPRITRGWTTVTGALTRP
ncbi:zf-HC2 domain-containing protein [Isoptericola croceus]|uniref:zf-HC2 domain-containing protein n=1 Tax=Isoptericola croceus TaxID=3031406 RepID=UPI0023F928AD|nr:zf-HC2 domain-containing protein [Isoptericola croceus]